MSIQQSIQTGVIIGNTIQTARLRQLLVAQHTQQQEIAAWRQIMFEGRKLLDAAARQINEDPVSAVYLVRLAGLSLGRVPETVFPDLRDKESLYQLVRHADDLLAQGEGRLSPEIAKDVHRLAWLEQMRLPFHSFVTWLQIQEKLRDHAILFTPGVVTFLVGMILCNILTPLSWSLLHVVIFSVALWLASNGITLVLVVIGLRAKLLAACDQMAKKAGGWVGPDLRPRGAAQLVETARAQLSSWGYRSTAVTSYEAGKGLAQVDAEIVQLRQLYLTH